MKAYPRVHRTPLINPIANDSERKSEHSELFLMCKLTVVFFLVFALASSTVMAGCPYSGYVPGMKSVVISKWEDVDYNDCLGICPIDVVSENKAWVDTNASARWIFTDNGWVKQYWDCKPISNKGSMIQDCRLYEQIPFQLTGNTTNYSAATTTPKNRKVTLDLGGSLSFDLKEILKGLSILILS